MLHLEFIKEAKKNWSSPAVSDSTGRDLSYGKLLAAGLWLARYIRDNFQEEVVAVNLPPSVGAVIANIAVALAGKTVMNLNYTLSSDTASHCLDLIGVKKMLTSRKFEDRLKEKFGFDSGCHSIYLEDALSLFNRRQKIRFYLMAKFLPVELLTRSLSPEKDESNNAAILFSSGSTGVPKGIVLTHGNIVSNIRAVLDFSGWGKGDCILGALPFFHSFGYTVTMWLPLIGGVRASYHPNPLEAETIGELAQRVGATIMMGTNYFFHAYLRKIPAERLASVRYAILGAEKMKKGLAAKWKGKFGIPLLEGYGCTELSPVVSCNMYDREEGGRRVVNQREGSVGRPLLGVKVRITDPETGTPQPQDVPGMLEVNSPSLMKGYFNDPDRTRKVVKDGWYITGDVARIDHDGFIFITDRLLRFSKIGGEMIPHIHIEGIINHALGTEEPAAVVTAVPDEKKGERLVALYLPEYAAHFEPVAFKKLIAPFNLPNLWTPREFYQVPEFPVLGSGKLDLKRLNELAAGFSSQRISLKNFS